MKEILYILLVFNYNIDTDSVKYIDTHLFNNLQSCEIRVESYTSWHDMSLCIPVDKKKLNIYPIAAVMTNVFKNDNSPPKVEFTRVVDFGICIETRKMSSITRDSNFIRTFCNIITR